MLTQEYKELKEQMDRIERLLSRLTGTPLVEAVVVIPDPPRPVTPEMSNQERILAVQEEGHYILDTQGIEAYKKFWQLQSKKARSRQPRVKKAA